MIVVDSGGNLRIVAGSGGNLRIVIGSGGNLRIVAGSGGTLRIVTGSGGTLRIVTGSGGNLRIVAGSGGNLRIVVGSGGNLTIVAGSGGNLQGECTDVTNITLALRTLGSFDFEGTSRSLDVNDLQHNYHNYIVIHLIIAILDCFLCSYHSQVSIILLTVGNWKK